jgi:hypothetical protein
MTFVGILGYKWYLIKVITRLLPPHTLRSTLGENSIFGQRS